MVYPLHMVCMWSTLYIRYVCARGRPRFGWTDGVKRALNDRRMDIREASEHARNRNEWQMIVTQF